ncbi:MAG: nucleotide-binding protein [Magnetococcales bacterium]|nr:nucleotide-binding protein [Magnetococcales bacterium]
MPNSFHGTFEELKAAFESTGIQGEWESDGQGKHTFRSRNKGVLNWWESKGTIQIQGKPQIKQEMESAWERVSSGNQAAGSPISVISHPPSKGNIFIVHGHDVDARDQLELVLHRLGLQPFILMNSSGGGKTIIEALEGHIGKDHTSDFGIVLMTPDDVGYAKKDGIEKAEPRARQNVLLETGMLLSSLTRERMALIVKGHLELPSDLQGIIRLGYNDHIREIVPKLGQRLKESGFDIDASSISTASA